MENIQLTFKKQDTLFHPKHIAFIGATENSTFGAMLYLPAFKNSPWADHFYPINPKYEKILDWKCYPSVLDVPFPIDTAYVSVKTKFILKILKECVEKKIKWVIIFASGFSETGESEGKEMERELIKTIEGSDTRIIGPNCLGPFNAENNMTFSFSQSDGVPGSVSFMSQSGGHVSQLMDVGFKRDLRFRYGISFGNQIDLNCIDILRHYRQDPKTKIIAAYLESFGYGNGHDFFLELKRTTKLKPVIIWKGGYTDDGFRAAVSHTGAIATDMMLWKAMIKQTGAILVKDNEEFWSTIKTFELLYPQYIPNGRNIGIITPGGGSSVNMTDLFAAHNLKIPELTFFSQEKIGKILPKENVNIKNPIDLGAFGFLPGIFTRCVDIVVDDPNIDIIIIPLWSYHLNLTLFNQMIEIQQNTTKPFAFCLPSIADSFEVAKEFKKSKKILNKKRQLYYFDMRDAANSISLFCDYIEYLKSHNYLIHKNS